jgi:hypothetical protein
MGILMHVAKRSAVVMLGLALVAGGGASALAAGHALSHDSAASPEAAGVTDSRSSIATATQLEDTTIVQSDDEVVIPSGKHQLGAVVTLTCPGATTCTLEADQYVQLTGTADNNRWAVCTHVDGQILTEPMCPYLGLVPNGFYGTGSYVQTMTGLTPGTHKVKTVVIAKRGARVTSHVAVYRMYTP